ncbi:hypothetical protein [Luteolibacter marinus]|uniref:hypothetical protein n=1 Tax=Luteolibacter marinus TaxID=2776705 RepID=UPI00186655D8|nr:hypothetical protein [Luteolibacter marinus]
MNLFVPILCVVAAGVAGYSLEPSMRYSLTGQGRTKQVVVSNDEAEEEVAPPVVEPAPTPVPAPTPAPVTPPEPAEPPAVVQADPEPEPEPVAEPPPVAQNEPEEMKEPEPEPEPMPEPAASLGPEEIVKAMQESIKAKQVKEFAFEQVLGWKAGEEEDVDGEKYQTGLASYKAETIFGVKTIQAKALISGGKVVKWIWPNSGMEIK